MDGYAFGGMLERCGTAGCGQKNRVRLRVCRRTAASKHRRSYAITLHTTTNISAMQGLSIGSSPSRLLWFFVSCLIWLKQT